MITSNVGETGRKLGTRLNEHKKDCEARTKNHIQGQIENYQKVHGKKSAITDHQNIENQQIKKLTGRGASIVEREQDWKMRKTKEAIQ